jgi:hypothetical protein
MIAMMGIKLNAQVMIKTLRNMHERSLPPTRARRRVESSESGVSGLGPLAFKLKAGASLSEETTHRPGGHNDRLVGWRMW